MLLGPKVRRHEIRRPATRKQRRSYGAAGEACRELEYCIDLRLHFTDQAEEQRVSGNLQQAYAMYRSDCRRRTQPYRNLSDFEHVYRLLPGRFWMQMGAMWMRLAQRKLETCSCTLQKLCRHKALRGVVRCLLETGHGRTAQEVRRFWFHGLAVVQQRGPNEAFIRALASCAVTLLHLEK